MGNGLRRFDRLHDETILLLEELKGYVNSNETRMNLDPTLIVSFVTIRETRRVVCRLATVMAWLLAKRAHEVGEISKLELTSDKFSLSKSSVCSNPSHEDSRPLPETLRHLLHKSHDLYVRVSRIENMVQTSLVVEESLNETDIIH